MNIAGNLARGRDSYARQAWGEAYEALTAADLSTPLDPRDVEMLATSAYMLGREHEFRELLERAYRGHLDAEERLAAVRSPSGSARPCRCAVSAGRPAAGWAAPSGCSTSEATDCVERGYLLVSRGIEARVRRRPRAFSRRPRRRRPRSASASAIRTSFSMGSFMQGNALIGLGRLGEGLALLDLAMVAVLAGEVSPVSSGLVYCAVILGCEEAHDLRRAREWTTALTEWCAGQPDLVAFTGRCMVHRAQILRLDGSWEAAVEEAQPGRRALPEGGEPVRRRGGPLPARGGPPAPR